MKHSKSCSCSFCVPELRSGCFSPEFCKPCGAKTGAAKKKGGTKRSPKRKS